MKVSELISKLQSYEKEFGDMEVYNLTSGEETWCIQVETACEEPFVTME